MVYSIGEGGQKNDVGAWDPSMLQYISPPKTKYVEDKELLLVWLVK